MKLEADPIIVNELRRVRQLLKELEDMERADIQKQVEALKNRGWVELNYRISGIHRRGMFSPDSGIKEWEGKKLLFFYTLSDEFRDWLASLPEDQYVWVF